MSAATSDLSRVPDDREGRGVVATLRRLGLHAHLPDLDAAGSVTSLRKDLGDRRIELVAAKLGHRVPTERTLRRWALENRIPYPDVAELLEREQIVAGLGGVAAAAEILNHSESAVRRWASGRQNQFRGSAHDRLVEARVQQTMRAAGVLTRGGLVRTPHLDAATECGESISIPITDEQTIWTLAATTAAGRPAAALALAYAHVSTTRGALGDEYRINGTIIWH